jgi:SAM-dependent methyltransferase
MTKTSSALIAVLNKIASHPDDSVLIADMIHGLDEMHHLAAKIAGEPGLTEIIQQFVGRIVSAYGNLSAVKGQRILDIACGSSTSKFPASVYVNSPLGEQMVQLTATDDYTAQFEPWFCRIVLALGAQPVGIDVGDMQGEAFEYYNADLGAKGALDFLPAKSFDAVQDSRLFGSPEFTAQFPDRSARIMVAAEIRRQEQRVLKPGGIVIHSDAREIVGW